MTSTMREKGTRTPSTCASPWTLMILDRKEEPGVERVSRRGREEEIEGKRRHPES